MKSGHFLLRRRFSVVDPFVFPFLSITSSWLFVFALGALITDGVLWCLREKVVMSVRIPGFILSLRGFQLALPELCTA
jgi:hypothetical protein